MEFKSVITKEVIDATLYCGVDENLIIPNSCAYAHIANQLIPHVSVGTRTMAFFNKKGELIAETVLSQEMRLVINKFDLCSVPSNCLQDRYDLVGTECTFEIPDKVIKYWLGDIGKVAEKIANSTCLKEIA